MSFQGSINNLLGTAAIAGRLSPGYESKQAAYGAKKKLKVLENQEAQITNATEGSTEHKIYQDIQEQKRDASKTLFESQPSKKTYQQYKKARWAAGEPISTFSADPSEILQEQADIEAEAALRREQERLLRTRQALMSNAPQTQFGIREKNINYGN